MLAISNFSLILDNNKNIYKNTALNIQEPIEKRLFVNYVQKTPEQEDTSEDIKRNYMLNSMEVQELRNVTSVLKASKKKRVLIA